MKVTKTPTEVNAYTLSFSDKVLFISLMDQLAVSFINDRSCKINDKIILTIQVEKMLKTLSIIGCRTSLGESYEDIAVYKANSATSK